MTTFDLSPLFRSTVGFDRVGRLLETAARMDQQALSYPPYNIEKTGDESYRIVMAVAGFGDDDLDVAVENNTLTISGKADRPEEGVTYLHRGIAERAFERRFQLAEHIEVRGAKLENGLLHIDLVHEVPEALKPRNIAIEGAAGKRKMFTGSKAA